MGSSGYHNINNLNKNAKNYQDLSRSCRFLYASISSWD